VAKVCKFLSYFTIILFQFSFESKIESQEIVIWFDLFPQGDWHSSDIVKHYRQQLAEKKSLSTNSKDQEKKICSFLPRSTFFSHRLQYGYYSCQNCQKNLRLLEYKKAMLEDIWNAECRCYNK
jgi:hypothetical protein